ncbi:MAG TPA: hypothetical protein VFK57_16135 [Vicinamibacterales bacterium]|nr:hypothetical protein [Vicinamibacterales bacterium]
MYGKAVWSRSLVVVVALIAWSAAPAQAQPKFHSSTQKYRERNATGAKGRAGGASLTARMLYAKNGTTELEATTGEFGSATPPPGTIWKLQLSALDALGAVMSTVQYKDLDGGGYFKQSYTNLWPGQPFQVQAHIRTSTKRNDTVTVTTSVQKRPDVAVSGLISPPRAPVNMPVKMIAVVSELNGNIGARTDCVLYVNDVEADRAAAIWVDSGDSVSCAFSPTLTTLGNNRLKVRAEGVDPGDWDDANNVFEKDVLVSTLTPDFDAAHAEALIYDVHNTSFVQQGRYINSTFTGGFDWLYEEKADTDGDIWTYTGASVIAPLAPPASVSASLTDGIVSWSAERDLSGCEDFAIGQVNGRAFWTAVTGCGGLFVQAGGYSGTVTYTSRWLQRSFTIRNGVGAYDGPAQYLFNNVETENVNGDKIFNGNNWTIDVKVVVPAASGGIFTFSKPLSFTLGQTLTDGVTNPPQCTSGAGVNYCETTSWKKVARYGETTFIQQ